MGHHARLMRDQVLSSLTTENDVYRLGFYVHGEDQKLLGSRVELSFYSIPEMFKLEHFYGVTFSARAG
jgi:hypothetical protein